MILSKARDMRILDFDSESRPLSYWYSDRPTAEMTAIAFGFTPESIETRFLGKDSKVRMLEAFVKAYDYADMVTGHYIRKFDLPMVNSELIENGMEPLKEKLTCDTKSDFIRHGDQPATLEFLGELLGLDHDKVHMTQMMWRNANRLTTAGLRDTVSRVKGDVVMHMELRAKMIERGLLHPPKMWAP